MNIVIKETGASEVLSLIDRNGTDCAIDIIGNYDGLGAADHQFAYDSESNVYICNQDTFDWWKSVLDDQQTLNDRIAELSHEHGSDAVQQAIGNAGECDLEDQAAAINAALDEAFLGK